MVAATGGRRRWAKFFWADWETDPALALCSMGAQGFWMRLLCICSNADGKVLIGGQRPTPEKLAQYTRQTVADVEAWLAELDEHGVFSRTRGGVIYSRRMRDDREKQERNRENGSKGGNPLLLSQGNDTEKIGSDNPPVKPGVKAEAEAEAEAEKKGEANASPGAPSKPDAPERARSKPDRRDAKSEPWAGDAGFDQLWNAATAPMRQRAKSRKVTWPEYVAAIKLVEPSALLAALKAYVAKDPDCTRTGGPGLQRWLRDRTFEQWAVATAPEQVTEERWAVVVRIWRESGEWGDRFGPPPGKPGCRVPAALLLEPARTGVA